MAEAVGTIRVDLFANTAEFGEGLNKASGQLKRFARDAEKTARQFDKVGKNLTASLTLPLVAFAGFAIKAAADAQDLQGAFNISFGDMSDSANAWAVTTGAALHRSTQTVQTTAIAFNAFFEDFAPNSKAALDLSETFTVLTEDFAAFHNVSREQSQQVLLAGLAGSAKGLKKFGIDISDAALQQRAYQLGIAKSNTELTEQQKVLARASIIIAGTAKEQGEVTRSTGETAEETERAKESFKSLLVTVGNDLLPVFNSFLSSVHDIIDGFNGLDKNTRTVIEVVGAVAAVAGPAALAIGALTRAAGFAATALRFLTTASAASTNGIKQVGISAKTAAVSFLVLAPAAYEAGAAVGSVVDDAFAPKFDEVKTKAEALKNALIAQGIGADQAREAVVSLLTASGGDLSKLTLDNAKSFVKFAAEAKHVKTAVQETTPSVDELIKSFGELAPVVTNNADELQRIRDTVDPTSAAIRHYTENLALAKAAGIDAGQAQGVFARQLIDSIGGVDGARAAIEKLPPAVQAVAKAMIANDNFATLLETYAEHESVAAEEIKKINEAALEAEQRASEELQSFADDLTAQFDPASVFTEQMNKIDDAFANGRISADVYKQAKDAAFAATPQGQAELDALRERTALISDLAGGLTDVATAGDDAGEAARRLILELLKAQFVKPFFEGILNSAVPQPGSSGGGFDIGSVVSAGANFLFGGAKDAGGAVFPGMSYRIGAGVAETFTPDVPGHITRGPGAAMGGGGQVINVYTPDANSFRSSQRQIARAAQRGLEAHG